MVTPPPASFLKTLLTMVENGDVLFDDGKLLYGNTQHFALEVLPRYFSHTNLSSFERQLYNYSWRKIAKGPKSAEPRVFYNQALQGQDPAMILEAQRKANGTANNTRTSHNGNTNKLQNKTSPRHRPLSKYSRVNPADIMAALRKKTPPARAKPEGTAGRGSMRPGLSAIGAAASATDSVDGNSRKRSRGITRTATGHVRVGFTGRDPLEAAEKRLSASFASAGGAGHGRGYLGDQRNSNTEGRPLRTKGGNMAMPLGTREGDNIGSTGRAACQRSRRTFCGWQKPRSNTSGERRAGGGGVNHGRGIGADGCAPGRGSGEDSPLPRAPTRRKRDDGIGAGGDDHGGDRSSIDSLLTAVQIEINQRRRSSGGGDEKLHHQGSGGGSSTPKPLKEHRTNSAIHLGHQGRLFESGCLYPPEVDHPSLPTPTPLGRTLPAAEALSVPQASGSTASASLPQDDGTSLKLVFTSRDTPRFPSPPTQQRLVGVNVTGTPTRSRPPSSPSPPFRNSGGGDAGFAGKNFGDGLLGSGGNGGGFGPTSRLLEHGSAAASDDVSSFLATGCCDDDPGYRRARGGKEETCGGGTAGGGLLSPARVLPLTPSPLSLDHPGECLLGLW